MTPLSLLLALSSHARAAPSLLVGAGPQLRGDALIHYLEPTLELELELLPVEGLGARAHAGLLFGCCSFGFVDAGVELRAYPPGSQALVGARPLIGWSAGRSSSAVGEGAPIGGERWWTGPVAGVQATSDGAALDLRAGPTWVHHAAGARSARGGDAIEAVGAIGWQVALSGGLGWRRGG